MYIVEGNIGTGKSTFLKLVQKHIASVDIVYEPLQSWATQVYGQSLLSNFYEDTPRWAYTMETLAMACRVKEHLIEQQNTYQLRLMERSIYSGHYVFATNDYQNGFLTTLEWNLYLKWFNFLVSGHCRPPQGFIYLKTDPEVAYERIKKRDRNAEKSISFDYIKQIHACHEDFLVEKADLMPELKNTPVLVLDCNADFETNHAQFMAHAQALQTFMNTESSMQPIQPEMFIPAIGYGTQLN